MSQDRDIIGGYQYKVINHRVFATFQERKIVRELRGGWELFHSDTWYLYFRRGENAVRKEKEAIARILFPDKE